MYTGKFFRQGSGRKNFPAYIQHNLLMPNTFRLYLIFILCFLSVTLGALDSVLLTAYLPDIARNLTGLADDATTGHIGSWASFCFLLGGTVGGIALGFLSDRIGRRAVLAVAMLCCGGGSGLGALAPTWEVLALLRAVVGVGVGTALVVSAVVVTERWPARSRAVALGLLSVAYPVGIITSGIITANVSDWRMAFAIGASALLLAVPVWLIVPESVEQPEAADLSAEASAKAEALRSASLAGYRKELTMGIVVYGTMLIGIWATFSWLPTWVQGLLGEGSPEGQEQRGLSMALLGGGGMVGGVASGFLAHFFGQKRVQMACFVACFTLSYFLFQTHTTFSTQIPVCIWLLGLCFGLSQGVLNVYIPELFPTALRSSATGLCFHVGRAFTAAAVWFVGAFVVWFGGYGNAIFAFSLVYVVGFLALLATQGRPEKPITDN